MYDNCSWEDIEKCRPKCQGYRTNFINENEVEKVFDKWTQYTNPSGYKLIEIDFNYKYAQSESLLEKWHIFEAAIISILKSEVKNPATDKLKDLKDRSKYYLVLPVTL